MGKNKPMKNRNEPAQTRSNGSSFNGRKNSQISRGFGCGFIREVMVKLAMMSMKSRRKAVIRIVQGKPTSGMRR